MTWRVIIRPTAEADLDRAKLWYNSKRAGLGYQVDEVGHALKVLEENPGRRPLYYKGFRRLLLRRFPYKIFYRVEEEQVIVFRILHVKRDHPRHL